ncbi:hypothetical protein ACE1MK_07350 [Tenacibaculum maritimum]|uniref:hypothetical protein n=1 Tax=Tenacibaculum maritimum TaxID=107401 RepID=UPI0012E49F52|nr:hypothetical protein [Tenacibaculum maritimum]CAA0245533.1 hypothetical protein TMP139_660003 [Tenacibaculum maritimum]CAA0253807.1 hypothetical protein USCSP91_750003 [Tenacibaculum maritimum]
MKKYHPNAKTDIRIRSDIYHSTDSCAVLASRYNISVSTVYKWKNTSSYDVIKSPVPNRIHYLLDDYQKSLLLSLRLSTYLPLDVLSRILFPSVPLSSVRSSVYRVLRKNKLNLVPSCELFKVKRIKKLPVGVLYVYVIILPEKYGKRSHFFISIDSSMKHIFFKTYATKNAVNVKDFINGLTVFYSFEVTDLLTDSDLDFSFYLKKSKENSK